MEKWLYSGEQIHELSARSLYHSPQVDDFLVGQRKFILLSAKGMGKTHLLRQKRKNLSESAEGRSATFIPSSSGSDVDRQTSLPKNLGLKALNSLSQEDWANLWEISIGLSALLNVKKDLAIQNDITHRFMDIISDQYTPESITDLIEQWVAHQAPILATPTYILNSILQTPVSSRQKFVKSAQNLILQLYPRYVTNAVYIFIDSFDQTLTDTYADAMELWINGQMGLALAVYNVFVNCSHIKVFASIRQEAWNKFQHHNKLVISSFSLELSYTKPELRKMVEFLCKYYEDTAFVDHIFRTSQHGKIRNFGVGDQGNQFLVENLFDYIYRHSLGTPRSILHLMDSICTQVDRTLPPDELEKAIRMEINLKSGTLAQTKIESEMAYFLHFLDSNMKRTELFSNIHKNILSLSDFETINSAISGGASNIHPFCELFNLGLLGVLKRDADGVTNQNFKTPMNFDWKPHECMPDSQYYLLHPALEAYLSERFRIQVEPGIVVSPDSPWDVRSNGLIKSRTAKIFISYSTVHRELRDKVIASINNVFLVEGIRHEYWVDEEEMEASERLAARISEGLDWADVLVALVTPSYIESKWCMRELETMLTKELSNKEKRTFTFLFGGASRADLPGLLSANVIPAIDETDAASMLQIGQSLKKLFLSRR